MLKEADKSRHSLSRCIFAGSWFIVLIGAVNYLFNGGPEVAALAGAILTPAGLVYAGREHTKRGDANA